MTARTDAMLYKRRLMQSEAAGMPTPAPIINFVAAIIFSDESLPEGYDNHLQISHQMGATFWRLSCQIIESTNCIRLASDAHSM